MQVFGRIKFDIAHEIGATNVEFIVAVVEGWLLEFGKGLDDVSNTLVLGFEFGSVSPAYADANGNWEFLVG
mgnify:CR=1 FL=1